MDSNSHSLTCFFFKKMLEEKAQQVPLQPLDLLNHTTPKPKSQVFGHVGGYQDPAD